MGRKRSALGRTAGMAYTALFAVLLAVCAWIAVPAPVPFTLQTFAVFCAMGMLGGKRGTACALLYIFLGMAGIPVFSGFAGGVGVLFGATGGYIVGFIFLGLTYWLITGCFGYSAAVTAAAMILGLLVCYAFGTVWFMAVYARASGPIGLGTALGWCVIPFIIPDAVKLALALALTKRLKKYIGV
ncbi:MAG TPA: biotin transporter BioY [Clostridiales bacterium]|nr:biotin transporter BioY [Clostridiales bacterium]HBR08841.1 biotin transporter BioY [Clostridiales bacterium]